MSTQRERFHAAWIAGGFDPEWVRFYNQSTGKYETCGADDAFAGFQLADNAALEVIAAKDAEIAAIKKNAMRDAVRIVEGLTHPNYMYGEEFSGWDTCIDAVARALLASQEGA